MPLTSWMGRFCKALGGLMLVAGIAALLAFASYVVRDENFARARLLKERNPGNVMYESQYFVAMTVRAFLIGGAVSGLLLALNGGTLLLVGALMVRVEGLRIEGLEDSSDASHRN